MVSPRIILNKLTRCTGGCSLVFDDLYDEDLFAENIFVSIYLKVYIVSGFVEIYIHTDKKNGFFSRVFDYHNWVTIFHSNSRNLVVAKIKLWVHASKQTLKNSVGVNTRVDFISLPCSHSNQN